MSEFKNHVQTAMNIFRTEGINYLEKDENEAFIKDLDSFDLKLKNLDAETLKNESFEKIVYLSPESRASILKIGIGKFSENLLNDSLSIFAFLSSLEADNPDYWYRLGLVAQKCDLNELALKSFIVTSELAPGFAGSHIYAAQCYLTLDQPDNAKNEVDSVKAILKESPGEESWNQTVVDIENLLAAYVSKEV